MSDKFREEKAQLVKEIEGLNEKIKLFEKLLEDKDQEYQAKNEEDEEIVNIVPS